MKKKAQLSRIDTSEATKIIRWSLAKYDDAIITTGLNLSGTVLLDIASKEGFTGKLIFVDTGFHFPETLYFWQELKARYDRISFVKLSPRAETGFLFETDPVKCCQINKIAPLEEYLLKTKPSALINARTRESAKGRFGLQVVENGIPIHINPLVSFSRLDLEKYAKTNQLIVHPLYVSGYQSMGCWPCTKAVRPGDDPRSGRFLGQGRTECGLWGSLGSPEPGITGL